MKIAIFDFEGTLVDFQWQLKPALEAIYPKIAPNIAAANLDRDLILKLDYCHLYNYLQRNISDPELAQETLQLIDNVFDYYDTDAARRWQLYPEVPKLLAQLKAAGWGIALDSNVGRKSLKQMFKKFALDDFFDLTVSRNDVSRLKPEPEGIRQILSYYNNDTTPPRQTFLIGDSVTDIETARNAGIKVAILINGEDKTERLRAHQPHYMISNLSEIKELILN
jgi:HAD superfamily hydrolase (TIGR01549 family)